VGRGAGVFFALSLATGWGKPEDQRKAVEAGFDVHLTKPVEGHELERVLTQRPTIH
jgi:CheY-like chemotaxis protein